MGQGFDVLLREELHGLPGNVRPGTVLVEFYPIIGKLEVVIGYLTFHSGMLYPS